MAPQDRFIRPQLLPIALMIAGTGLVGCVLSEPAGDITFSPIVSLQDAGGGNNGVPDMPRVEPPELVFTEVMFDAPGSDPEVSERGEFVEIKNVGRGPADPREIVLFLTNLDTLSVNRLRVEDPFLPEEIEAYDALRPIEPDQYFVFVRHEDAAVMPVTEGLPDGSFYDYGRFANGASLPHQGLALFQLDLGYRYPDNTTEIFDTIRWSEHEFYAGSNSMSPLIYREAASVEVEATKEGSKLNDDPADWCVTTTELGMGFGTPGGPGTCE